MVSCSTGISKSVVHQILKLKATIPTTRKVQELIPENYEKKVLFCKKILQRNHWNDDFLIIFIGRMSPILNALVFSTLSSFRVSRECSHGTFFKFPATAQCESLVRVNERQFIGSTGSIGRCQSENAKVYNFSEWCRTIPLFKKSTGPPQCKIPTKVDWSNRPSKLASGISGP